MGRQDSGGKKERVCRAQLAKGIVGCGEEKKSRGEGQRQRRGKEKGGEGGNRDGGLVGRVLRGQ
jgi:hypothetical protein